MLTKSRSKNKTTYATTRLVLQKGLEIKAQLQKHALRVKLSSVDMRKGQEISEGNYGFSIKNYGILLPKLFRPTVRKNCPSDREKLLKFETEG